MGKFNRMKQAEARQALEIIKGDAGEVLDFGAYALGCPSCGGFERGVKYHLGSALTSVDRSDCNISGRHLHYVCQCGRLWITRCKFDTENESEAPSSIEKMHDVIRAIASVAGEGGLAVSLADLVASSKGTVFIEDADDGYVVKYRA